MNEKSKKKLFNLIKTVLVAVFWIAVWYVVSVIIGLDVLIPSPVSAAKALVGLLGQKSFLLSCGKTLLRVLTGWGSGLIFGLLLACLTGFNKLMSTLFSPLIHIIRATPVASFIVLTLVLMSSSRVPVFTGFLMTVPVVWANIGESISAADKELLEAADFFKMTKRQKLINIYIPNALPYFTAGATTSMGLAWKACVAAEVLCTPSGSIGSGIQNAKIYLETPELFAWTVTVIIMSVLLEKLIKTVLTQSKK